MFRNGQPDCDDVHIIFVAMTATLHQEKFKDTERGNQKSNIEEGKTTQ